jgi:hypothetical protein
MNFATRSEPVVRSGQGPTRRADLESPPGTGVLVPGFSVSSLKVPSHGIRCDKAELPHPEAILAAQGTPLTFIFWVLSAFSTASMLATPRSNCPGRAAGYGLAGHLQETTLFPLRRFDHRLILYSLLLEAIVSAIYSDL